jgi:hypothetical protein
MRRLYLLCTVALVLLAGCAPALVETSPTAPPPPAHTPVPPTPTTPPTGIAGRIEYTGSSTGGLLVFAVDHPPVANESPVPAAITAFTATTGEFTWDLPAGTYYIIAFLTIDRPPEGPPLPNEPLILCEPVTVVADQMANVVVVLTDEDAGGADKACVPAV